jgi:hypothetical protein
VQARSGDPEPIAAWSGSTLAGATRNDTARFTVRFVLRPAQ